MKEKRVDNSGRALEIGERYDSKNNRYVFQKMVNGERISFSAHTLEELRKKKIENGILDIQDDLSANCIKLEILSGFSHENIYQKKEKGQQIMILEEVKKVFENFPMCHEDIKNIILFVDNKYIEHVLTKLIDVLRYVANESYERAYLDGYDDCLSDKEVGSESVDIFYDGFRKYAFGENNTTRDFVNFVKSEIPDVYKKLLKEFRKRNRTEE